MNDPLFTRLHIWVLTLALAVTVVFVTWPGLDLAISTALTDGQGQFIAVRLYLPVLLSAGLRSAMELAALGAILYTVWLWLARRADRDWLWCWSYLSGVLLLGPGLIVNLVLKEHVGRARPGHLAQFGGESSFSPAFLISDQCSTNCSFTSGEAALSAALTFVLISLIWPHLGLKARGRAVAMAAGFVILAAGLRVVLGRHFPSDVLVSVLISAMAALGLYRGMRVDIARRAFTPARLLAWVHTGHAWLRNRGRKAP